MQTHVVARVFLFNEQRELLLLVRADSDTYRPGEYDIPGGKVDDNEDYVQAALRETLEEAGVNLNRSAIHPLYASSGTGHSNRLNKTINYIVIYFVGRTDVSNIVLSDEHKVFEWCSMQRASQLLAGSPQEAALKHLIEKQLYADYWQV